MKYGAGADICVGKFLADRTWIDYAGSWNANGPKLRHFRYEDDGGEAALLLEDFHVRVRGRVFSALAGWDYDGSSKPRVVWSIVGHPFIVGGLIQFTLHDEVYCMNLLPRAEADWMMLETLGAFGGNNWANRNAVWSAVRAGGGFVYPKTSEELAKYKDYVFMTDLSAPVAGVDPRLTGLGSRVSVRPEITL